MKLILILLFMPMALFGQKNTISLVYQPVDAGIGVRYDRQIKTFGVYTSISHGEYWLSEYEKVKNHVKFVIGGEIFRESSYLDNVTHYFSIGLSYHKYGEKTVSLPGRVYYPYSIDLGTGVQMGRFSIGFGADFLKREGTVNIGFIL